MIPSPDRHQCRCRLPPVWPSWPRGTDIRFVLADGSSEAQPRQWAWRALKPAVELAVRQ